MYNKVNNVYYTNSTIIRNISINKFYNLKNLELIFPFKYDRYVWR